MPLSFCPLCIYTYKSFVRMPHKCLAFMGTYIPIPWQCGIGQSAIAPERQSQHIAGALCSKNSFLCCHVFSAFSRLHRLDFRAGHFVCLSVKCPVSAALRK